MGKYRNKWILLVCRWLRLNMARHYTRYYLFDKKLQWKTVDTDRRMYFPVVKEWLHSDIDCWYMGYSFGS